MGNDGGGEKAGRDLESALITLILWRRGYLVAKNLWVRMVKQRGHAVVKR